MRWGGWEDNLSRLKNFQYEIHHLIKTNNGLAELKKMENGSGVLSLSDSSKAVELPEHGMYSLLFAAYDKAGNKKTARRLIFFDDRSVVSHDPTKHTYVITGTANTNYTWIVQDTNTVILKWKGRFRNALHHVNGWLTSVAPYHDVDKSYDDYSGKRTVNAIDNVQGCVNFRVGYSVFDGSRVKDFRSPTSVTNIYSESDTLTLNWSDGDKAVLTVTALDIFNKTLSDTITIYRDSTPPIVENLWLTRGDRLNVSVHRLEDFSKMIIEWLAFDYHSGLDSIYWRLFDNFTGKDIVHGHEHIPAQGYATDLAHCRSLYHNYSRGPDCYQTNHTGAYHRHFLVKPEVKTGEGNGLVLGRDKGIHDYDYFLEVNATNKALLSTVVRKKITIDISPPHTGTVQDGMRGTDEVDFQQSKTLNAHWDGFFDKESGVLFYMYGFHTEPIPAVEFQLNSANSLLHETCFLHATHTVATEGTYYVCVVAFNRALEPSYPVCSDGVTVNTAKQHISEVDISSARVTGGLITDTSRRQYWVVDSYRHRKLIENPTSECINKVTLISVTDLDLLPISHHKNGTQMVTNGSVICSNTSSAPSLLSPVLAKSSHITLSWSSNETNIHDYEVGLSTVAGSTAPDILSFRSTKQHRHIHLMHTDLPEGKPFFIIFKTISKSSVEGIQSVGPCFVDTTPPMFQPPITVVHKNGYLVVSWKSDSLTDTEDPFLLKFHFALGHTPRGTQVQKYSPLMAGAGCMLTEPPTCTAIPLSDTEWKLHGNHTYYVTIKAENAAGLTTFGVSEPYIHNVQLPSTGIVIDIAVLRRNCFQDIDDIDFTSETKSIGAKWTGFSHVYLDVTYQFRVGSTPGSDDVVPPKNVGSNVSHIETGLSLSYYQIYFVTVTAISSAGRVEVTSDGVTVVRENDTLSGVLVFDGEKCSSKKNSHNFTLAHHDWDIIEACKGDIDYQSSKDSISGYWSIPKDIIAFTPDMYFSIEEKTFFSDIWKPFRDYEYNHNHQEVRVTGLLLSPGREYRIAVKLCAKQFCHLPTHSNGITILSNVPDTGKISIKHANSTGKDDKEKLEITMDKFSDPDILSPTKKYVVIDKYEWAILDNSRIGSLHTKWTQLKNFNTQNKEKISFIIELVGEFDFSKCRRFAVRGYNKAMLYSTVSLDVKDCNAFDPILIRPKTVIDAVGRSDLSRDGYGEPISLQTNDRWPYPDKDYTPHMNYISAVWPQLRYKSYTVAVLNARTVDSTTYYLPSSSLSLPDPCSHPDSLQCNTTEHEFINFKFKEGELEHGQRYMVCIHAAYTEIKYEKWTQVLPEINECSDGIVVDLTPPVPGKVWIGNEGVQYQISTTDMFVTWESFRDVEEYKTGSHTSGVQMYQLSIGTFSGGNDVVAFFDVGVVNHKNIHGLTLHSGYKYYATIKATDFANRTTMASSSPVTVDTSPPVKSNNPITLSGRHIYSKTEIETCWNDVFSDPESGMDYFMWSIGSEPGHFDVMYFTRVDSDCGMNNKSQPLNITEGHAYFISVKAFNKAHLMSVATSWAYTVDLSPPTKGHVLDISPTGNSKMDIDFQTDMSILKVYWEGFYEPHSSIKEYFITVGTCLHCDDVIGYQSVGLVNDLTVDFVHFGPGLTYYTTVTACNTADLCTMAVSDGVIMDNSPPNVGMVIDGTSSADIEYQSIKNWIGVNWFGFNDPQSGLSHYVWWAGTTPGGKEILLEREVHLTQIATAYNITPHLRTGPRVYVTVRAYNKAGQFADSTSNGFVIDDTPPVIVYGPRFSKDFGINGNTQFYRGSMKVEWDVKDEESYIDRQYISIKCHIGGDFQTSSIQVNGISRDYIFTGLSLHDGVNYFVTLIACNGAAMCVSSTSKGMLVDTTKPNRGMFAVHTDHAAELSRHVSGFMTWTKYRVNLAWLGFGDPHSEVSHYFVNIGSTYMGADLNTEPGKAVQVNHTTTGADRFDEGKVQTYSIRTQTLSDHNFLYISVWGVNKVGLTSYIVHSKFKMIHSGGILSLVRRCDAHDCEGNCVCAPQDKVCFTNDNRCVDVSVGNPNNLLQVNDVMYGSEDIAYTPTNTILQGRWSIIQRQGNPPLWYQWSVGITDGDEPSGIFNLEKDRVWHDAGQNNFIIFSTDKGQFLDERVSYSVFVKAWYDQNTFAIFKSDGVIISTRKPSVMNILGSSVSEKMMESGMKDQDYVKEGAAFMVNWTNKFTDAKDTIKSYHVYISSQPGGHDIWDSNEELQNTVTTYHILRILLSPGVQYFSNVIAYGFSGIHHTESSDGFRTDDVRPRAGIVYDGIGLHDLEYQNTSNVIGARWHGFSDTGSGILLYYWCVGNTSSFHTSSANTECNVRQWENVGIHTSVSRKLKNELLQGATYYSKVYAVDTVGYESEIVVSDGVKIDTTPPKPRYLYHTEENLLQNPSFESSKKFLSVENINVSNLCSLNLDFLPDHWHATHGSCASVVKSQKNLARDGKAFLFLRGSLRQKVQNLKVGELYHVVFFTSHLSLKTAMVSNKEGFVHIGKKKHVFMLYTKPYRQDGHGESISRETLSWHRHTFYFTASDISAYLEIGSTDTKTGLFVEHLTFQRVERDEKDGNESHVSAHIVYIHQWGSIHAEWSFIEDSSPIAEYKWAIGYTKGGIQLQSFESTGLNNFGINTNVTLIHNTVIHITAVASNMAGLDGLSYSAPVLVDLTPPEIVHVYDGRLTSEDKDAWIDNEVAVNFVALDNESGIEFCEWGIGYQPQGVELQTFEKVPVSEIVLFKDFDYNLLANRTVYSTIRCQNRAGLITSKSSDGVTISTLTPSVAHSEVVVLPMSVTEYQANVHYQSVKDSVRIKWSGFTDSVGIDQYKVSFYSFEINDKMSFPIGQDVQSAVIMNLAMDQGLTNISIQAINKLLLAGSRVPHNITVLYDKPRKSGNQLLVSWHAGNKEFSVTWNNVFNSEHPLYYEVCAGTVESGSNVLQWQETTKTSIKFGLPPTITSWSSLSVHLYVRAINVAGIYEDIKGEIILPE
ncbi:uncharacterized protein LOC133201664 [Saccostrea echinata]|uniref:uncharacterized protein LOC133201664 n=1 Tax=Saccostrea echinata TaxID=191078 RepID=UPI002A7ECA04|nr:uncharacterized protein LOC133201664 [Saccostrea echinata]